MSTPLDPKRIRTDLDTQSRVVLNEETVKEYAEAMEAGQEFPPILVFYDEPNDNHILAEGFHRLAAHRNVKPNEPIQAEMRLGTVDDARWASLCANKSHGLRRTNEDKRHAVKLALLHPKGAEETNRGIANHVGVAEGTVRNIRSELEASAQITQITSRTVRRGDQVYRQNTAGINFGRKTIPPGSTCATCRAFEHGHCHCLGSDPVPWTEACDDWEIKVEDKPNRPMPPPDYDNIEEYADTKKTPNSSNPHHYRRLKGCVNLHLPPDNPQLFAVELRNSFTTEYLTACIAALKHILSEQTD